MPAQIENGARVVESFLQTLMAQGYVPESIAAYRKRCRHFIVWLYLHDVALAEVDDDVFSRFLLHDCTCAHPHFFIRTGRFAGRNNSRSKIGLFIDYLIGTGIAARHSQEDRSPERPVDRARPRIQRRRRRRAGLSTRVRRRQGDPGTVAATHRGDGRGAGDARSGRELEAREDGARRTAQACEGRCSGAAAILAVAYGSRRARRPNKPAWRYAGMAG